MESEEKLVDYVLNTPFDTLPPEPLHVLKDVLLIVLGGIVAGASVKGCPEVIEQCREWGGKKEATILIYGNRVSARNAAFANSFMARTMGVDAAMLRGVHAGGSTVPTALAVAELVGGCSGKEFLTALVVGTEIAARINSSTDYNGFDPTGVCAVFATAAIAGRILGLSSEQMWNGLGHAFNRSGGSFQGTVDGSIAARVLQASASQAGIESAQMAKRGVSGPRNFLEGIYGYFHLYARDKYDREAVAGELGNRYELNKTFFKKYPSCGTTHASIDAILLLMRENGIAPEDLNEIGVTVTPHTYRLTGKPFEYGDNPRISAKYSIQYCVANAILRGGCNLGHFEEAQVREPGIMEMIKKIRVSADPLLDERNHLATDIKVLTRDGMTYHKSVDFPRGTPENPLTPDEPLEIFRDCMGYGEKRLPRENTERIISIIHGLEEIKDVRTLIPLLVSEG